MLAFEAAISAADIMSPASSSLPLPLLLLLLLPMVTVLSLVSAENLTLFFPWTMLAIAGASSPNAATAPPVRAR